MIDFDGTGDSPLDAHADDSDLPYEADSGGTAGHLAFQENFDNGFDTAAADPYALAHFHDAPRFQGFDHVTPINDNQGPAPTCFPETVENILQLYNGDTEGSLNDLSARILDEARERGLASSADGVHWVIPNAYHQAVFAALGIPTEVHDFDHALFKHYLDRQCPLQLGVDSAYLGNPESGPHSIALIDVRAHASGEWYYRVLDSANPQQEWYRASDIAAAALSAREKWPADGHNGRALVCLRPALNWPFKT
jgi:hypothetical protein